MPSPKRVHVCWRKIQVAFILHLNQIFCCQARSRFEFKGRLNLEPRLFDADAAL